jgi:hypothetical protein
MGIVQDDPDCAVLEAREGTGTGSHPDGGKPQNLARVARHARGGAIKIRGFKQAWVKKAKGGNAGPSTAPRAHVLLGRTVQ